MSDQSTDPTQPLISIPDVSNRILWCKNNAPNTAFRWGQGFIWLEPNKFEPNSLSALRSDLELHGFTITKTGNLFEHWEMVNWASRVRR